MIEAAAAKQATWRFNLYEEAIKAVWNEVASPRWQETVSWSRRLFERDDFDVDERDYKLELAKALAEARAALHEQREDWIDLLRRAFRSRQNNLTNYRAHERFLDWLKEHPADGRAALEIVWRDPDDEDPRLVPFLEAVPKEAIAGAGTRVSFASFLLLAVEPTRWPFFKPTPYDRLCKLLGVSIQASLEVDPEAIYRPDELAARLGLDGRRVREFLRQTYPREESERGSDWYLSADQAERVVEQFGAEVDPQAEEATYSHWWTLLEQLRLRMLATGTELRDLLDAQGIAWCLTNGHAPGLDGRGQGGVRGIPRAILGSARTARRCAGSSRASGDLQRASRSHRGARAEPPPAARLAAAAREPSAREAAAVPLRTARHRQDLYRTPHRPLRR